MGKSQTRQDLRGSELQFSPQLLEQRSSTVATGADRIAARALAGNAEPLVLPVKLRKLQNLMQCPCAGTLPGIEELSVAGHIGEIWGAGE